MRKREKDAQDGAGRLYPLVMIEWVDSSCNPCWQTGEPEPSLTHCRSVGWLLYDGKEAKVIAAHVADESSDNMQRNTEMTIPTRAVTKMRRIG
jgi:hypothetical protein